MKRQKTLLRSNAALAKKRLAGGFWNQKHERAMLENLNDPDGEDEKLYRLVVNILNSGNQNPLGAVLDQAYMQELDEPARQRYVLKMSKLVNKSIERYNKVG